MKILNSVRFWLRKRAEHRKRSEAAKKAWRTRKLRAADVRVAVARADFEESYGKTDSHS